MSQPLIDYQLPRPLYGQRLHPRNSPDALYVSGLRWNAEYGYHVFVTGNPRPFFMAGMALAHVAHGWLEMECTIKPGTIVLTGPDYRASAEAAKAYYEAFVYDESSDPEFMEFHHVVLNDVNSFWWGME